MAGYFCNRQVNRPTSESSLHNHDVKMKLPKYEIKTIGEGPVKQFQTIDSRCETPGELLMKIV